MKYDNVDYRTECRNEGPEIGGSTQGGDGKSPANTAATIFATVFGGIGTLFAVLGVVLFFVSENPLPGTIFIPLGVFFAVLGFSIGKSIRSGALRPTVRGIPTGSTREAYVYSANPAYGASEHDELRARVGEQQRRIDALERRCDALEAEINHMK